MHDDTFLYRSAGGIFLFTLLGLWDYRKHPDNPKRLKEYAFLFGITALTMVYGVVHDYVTWSISRDYFVLIKGIPSAEHGFGRDMVRLAMLATWNVGLIGAVIALLSNNPDAKGRQLPYQSLLKRCWLPLVSSVVVEIIFGVVFSLWADGVRDFLPIEVLVMGVDDALIRVWGMHLGAYIGAGIGVVILAMVIVRAKRHMPEQDNVAIKGWLACFKLG